MEKLIKKVSNVLNIIFKGNYASRGGVSFRRGTQASVMVGSEVYNNVYGIITDKISDSDMKNIANNMANITNIGKLISVEMKKAQVEPHGRWFVTSHTVRTQVVYKNKIYNAVYSKNTGKQIGKLGIVPADKVKPASIPRFKNVYIKVVEEAKAASKFQEKEFDFKRFGAYIDLVESLRPTYKGLKDYLRTAHKAGKIVYSRIDLSNKELTIDLLIQAARRMSLEENPDRKYPEVIVDIRKAINTVNKKKESASAGSSLPKEFQVEIFSRKEEK